MLFSAILSTRGSAFLLLTAAFIVIDGGLPDVRAGKSQKKTHVCRSELTVLRPQPLKPTSYTIMSAPPPPHIRDLLFSSDAVRVGRLHTMCDGWAAASLQYMGSGGFAVSSKVKSIETETLVLWGRQDKILDPKLYADR